MLSLPGPFQGSSGQDIQAYCLVKFDMERSVNIYTLLTFKHLNCLLNPYSKREHTIVASGLLCRHAGPRHRPLRHCQPLRRQQPRQQV